MMWTSSTSGGPLILYTFAGIAGILTVVRISDTDQASQKLFNNMRECIDGISAIGEPAWQCSASTAEMYVFLRTFMRPHWERVYAKHGLPSVFWCALYQVRSPIATLMWETFVCPLLHSPPLQRSHIPFLEMPSDVCQRIAPPPSDILPRVPGNMYPAGFDAHPFGLFLGDLLVDDREPESRILQLFPEGVCGYAFGPSTQPFTYRGISYADYSPKCPHNMAIHSMVSTIVKRSPDPARLNLSHALRLHLAPHGFGHGLFPRFSLRRALQICEERGIDRCDGGVFHSVGNWLRPSTGLQQLDTILPCNATSGDELYSLRLNAAGGYRISSSKQNATFGVRCNFDYYHAFNTFIEWARQC